MLKNNFLKTIWGFLSSQKKPSTHDGGLIGSQFPIQVGSTKALRYRLGIPEAPVRPIYNDLNISYEICELATWSLETRHSVRYLSNDCFQRQDGRVASWEVAETLEDGTKVHPDVLAIGKEISNRYNGKNLILGGNRLQRAARDVISYGDSFLEIAIDREGVGRNDWCISNSMFLPSLSTFVDEDEHGQLVGYSQRSRTLPSKDDIYFHPLKVLHFSLDSYGLYGSPLAFQNLEPWRKLKAASIDLEEASRACGVSPWLHIMPEGKQEEYKNVYAAELRAMRNDGIITDLYLLHGADLRKAATDSGSLEQLINYNLNLRYQCIIPGVPVWLFPGLGLESSSGKDIANQPALAYFRTISNLRSCIGEQIKWAISIEVILKKGFEWYLENGRFDINWGEWFVSVGELQMQQAKGDESDVAAEADSTNSNTPPSNTKKKNSKDDDSKDEERLLLSALMLTSDDDVSLNDLPEIENLITKIDRLLLSQQLSSKYSKPLFECGVKLHRLEQKLKGFTNGNGHYKRPELINAIGN